MTSPSPAPKLPAAAPAPVWGVLLILVVTRIGSSPAKYRVLGHLNLVTVGQIEISSILRSDHGVELWRQLWCAEGSCGLATLGTGGHVRRDCNRICGLAFQEQSVGETFIALGTGDRRGDWQSDRPGAIRGRRGLFGLLGLLLPLGV